MLPLIPLTFHLEQQDPLRLPQHAGSMLRGAFGSALRKVACMTGKKDCKTCPLKTNCAYIQIFESPLAFAHTTGLQGVNPYVIQPPAMGSRTLEAGEPWSFNCTLMGKATDQIAMVVYAWKQVCASGFNQNKAKATLLGITQEGKTVTDACIESRTLAKFPMPKALSSRVLLKFLTPLRVQRHGHVVLVRDQLTAETVLMALASRVNSVLTQHTYQPSPLNMVELREAARSIQLDPSQLQRHDVQRFSSRQQQVIDLDGLIGEIELSGEALPLFQELLSLGEYIHVGKNATHGLGWYKLINYSRI